MWWPVIGALLGSCLFNNESFLSYVLTLPSLNSFVELSATLIGELVCHVMQNPGNVATLCTISCALLLLMLLILRQICC